jgi:phosphoglycolate phosphatase
MTTTIPGQSQTPVHSQVQIREGFEWDAQDAYLFDIDGTLLRSTDRIHYDSFFSSVRQQLGRELLLDNVVVHGNTDPGILRDAFRADNLDEAQWRHDLAGILEHMRRTVIAQRDAMTLRVMPGVAAVLAHLREKGATLGVATGNLEVIGWAKIEVAGLRDWFTFGGFSDSYESRADMIANAAVLARSLAGPGATVCVVGDTPFDISAARANGLPTIAVATGKYSFDELLQSDPEVCATTLQDLLDETLAATSSASGAHHVS